MNIDRTAQVSPFLSTQQTANDHAMAAVKLANKQIEAQGAAALALVQAIPQLDSRIGRHVNITV